MAPQPTLAQHVAGIAAGLRADAAGGGPAVLHTLFLVALARLLDRLGTMIELWQSGRPAPARGAGRKRRKQESSFCEQKEAKKLHSLPVSGAVTRFASDECSTALEPSGHGSCPRQTDEVFLLLFVHKKKTLASLAPPPGRPRITPRGLAPAHAHFITISKQ